MTGMLHRFLLFAITAPLLVGCDDNPLEGLANVDVKPRLASLDLDTGDITELPTAPTLRLGAEAVAFHDGKIYVMGGFTPDFSESDAVDIYDIASSSWQSGAPMPNKRVFAHAAVLGDLVCVGSGTTAGLAIVEAFDCYDTTADSWIDASWPGGAALFPVAVDDAIYAFGGDYGDSTTNAGRFDAADQSWSDIASVPNQVATEAIATNGDDIHVIDRDGSNTYNTITNTWTAMTPAPSNDVTSRAIMVGSELYVVFNGEGNPPAAYDPATDAWRPIAAPPVAFDGGALAATSDSLLVGSGDGEDQPLNEAPILRYNTADDSWETLGTLQPTEVDRMGISGLFVQGSTVFIVGHEESSSIGFGG